MQTKKLSVIVPNYNNEAYLNRSVQYLLNQSYKNIEIIVVNDGSLGNSDEIMKKYQSDDRIKYISYDKNQGLFKARLIGADQATGDYITFLDADDYASIDFYRTLLMKAEETKSDIVIGNTTLEYSNGSREEISLHKIDNNILQGATPLNLYFAQEGLNYAWHTVWNKIYNMVLWKQARKYYDAVKNHLVMTEDFAFSTVLFYFSKKVSSVNNDVIFYCQHDGTSTSSSNISYNKANKNIDDLITSFEFVENFLKEKKVYNIYENNFNNWKHLYSLIHRETINKSKALSKKEKEELNVKLDKYCSDKSKMKKSNFFEYNYNKWNDGFERIKLNILDKNTKVVSFDIFDTLVTRPFLKPTDLFTFLDEEYYILKNDKTGLSFSKMRILSEQIARDNCDEEVTLDDIYEALFNSYDVPKTILNKMKKKEIELELRFCSKRKAAYELFTLAKDMNKKVICTSDMYLPSDVIRKILQKNGYNEDKLYLSCVINKTKATGSLYKYIINDLKVDSKNILHIGDNYNSDYKNAKEQGINAMHFPKASDVFMDINKTRYLSKMLTSSLPFWQDNRESQRFIGIRCMMAVVANKYFDNPFITFVENTNFNSDPYLVGYYALGMYLFGVSNWLINASISKKYDKISFMARDGYLPMEAYKLFSKIYNDLPKVEYMYVSRKALIPIMMTSKSDFYKLSDILDINSQTPSKVNQYLLSVLKISNEKLKQLCLDNKINLDKNFKNIKEFNKYIKLLVNNFYDEKENIKNREVLKEYFNNILGERPAVFDVGYSARPEFYLSNLCNKKIDTYFLNINKDEALEYSRLGDFPVYTYFPAKPVATGNAYEYLFSKLSPSCIEYKIANNTVEEVFENYHNNYQTIYIVDVIQKAALEFVSDMINIFDEDINKLYYQDYYITLPIMAYFNASNKIDKYILSGIEFEDEIRTSEVRNMVKDMNDDLSSKNQCLLNNLFNLNQFTDNSSYKLSYNPYVNLENRNKFVRLIYYYLFDKKTFKRRFDVFKKNLKK